MLTYSQLWQDAHAAKELVRDRCGVDCSSSQRTVFVQIGNNLDFPTWFLGIVLADMPVFPIAPNVPRATLDKLVFGVHAAATVSRSDGEVTVAAAERDHRSRRGLPGTEPDDDCPQTPTADEPGRSAGLRSLPPRSGLLLASSGTTAVPKIVHRSIASLDAVARNMVRAIGFDATDRVLASVPLTHSYGLEHGLLAPLWAGASVHLAEGASPEALGPRPMADITIVPAVPAMIEMLAETCSPSDVSRTVRLVYSAGAPLPGSVRERFMHRCSRPIGQVFGMTEIGSVTFNDPRDAAFNPGRVGRPMGGVSLRVVDPDSRSIVPIGTPGELVVKAPSMLSGYLGETAVMEDGHFVTGDLGVLDGDGQLTITGRRRLLIDTGALKVNPLEIEATLCEHPGVHECVVVPIRQSDTVDRLRAIVVPRDPLSPPTENSLRAFARQRLASGKVPRLFELAQALPRTASGKVQRSALEDR